MLTFIAQELYQKKIYMCVLSLISKAAVSVNELTCASVCETGDGWVLDIKFWVQISSVGLSGTRATSVQ